MGQNRNGYWLVHIDGRAYNLNGVYRTFGLAPRTVKGKLEKYKHSRKKAARELQMMLFKVDAGVPIKEVIYFSECGNCWCSISILREQTLMNHNTAYRRLRDWSSGLIDPDELFAPVNSEARKRGRPAGVTPAHRLTVSERRKNREREERLKYIPGPTPIERQLWGY